MTSTMGGRLEEGAQKLSSSNVLGGLPGGGDSSCRARLPQMGSDVGPGAEGRRGVSESRGTCTFACYPECLVAARPPQRPPHWGLVRRVPGGRP